MPDFMDVWALTEWDTPLRKIRQPIPTPKGTEVLVKVTHVGVCHSDLHFAEGFYDLGGGKLFYVKDRGIQLPVALGHEILRLGCGSCTRCGQEADNLCAAQKGLGTVQNDGFAEYVVVPHPKYLVDLGTLDPAVACTFSCSGITTLSAVGKVMPIPPSEPVLLIGARGLGLSAISVLRTLRHEAIVVADISDDKLTAAAAAGATKTVNTSGPFASRDILAATNGPVIAVIDFVNNSSTASLVNGLVAKGAKWVQVGVMGGSIELSLVANIFKGLTIYSNITGNLEGLRKLVQLANEGKLSPVPVHKMAWDSVNEAMELLQSGKVSGRIVLVK
ncbi:unnamed protein product [Clonostachys solani]|uniref:Enoyl reductase (ER) domain-containing protein n=1 Tax=Clonostachys solani TaxID=160281 RepID=A0A9N9ZM80_9HYPO|nr:unnamed protein product [Clonostachys solani]